MKRTTVVKNREGCFGFTLLESIIYIALFSILFTGVFLTVYPIFSSAEKLTNNIAADSETAFLLSKINYAINDTVTSSGVVVTVPNTNDKLTLQNGSKNYVFRQDNEPCSPPQQCSFLLLNDIPLNNSRVRITDFKVVKNSNPNSLDVTFAANGATTTARYYLRF